MPILGTMEMAKKLAKQIGPLKLLVQKVSESWTFLKNNRDFYEMSSLLSVFKQGNIFIRV